MPPARTGLTTAIGNWAGQVHNNLSERTLRAIALGRKHWGVFGSESGGRSAAVLYSVVGTCKHLGLDPFAYLRATRSGMFALGQKPTAETVSTPIGRRW